MSGLPQVELPFSRLPMELQYMVTQYMQPYKLKDWLDIGDASSEPEKHPIYLSFHKFMGLALPYGGPPNIEEALHETSDDLIRYDGDDYEEMLQYIVQLDSYWAKRAQANPNDKVCCITLHGTIRKTNRDAYRSAWKISNV